MCNCKKIRKKVACFIKNSTFAEVLTNISQGYEKNVFYLFNYTFDGLSMWSV